MAATTPSYAELPHVAHAPQPIGQTTAVPPPTGQPLLGQPVYLTPQTPAIVTPMEKAKLRARIRLFTGRAQVICGVSVFILGFISVLLKCMNSEVGSGMWSGVLFTVTGGFGISSAKHKRCSLVTYLTLCIVSAVFAGFCIIVYFQAASMEWMGWRPHHSQGVRVAVDVLLLVVALVEFVVAIVGSASCCSRCCCYPDKTPTQQVIYYAPQSGMPIAPQGFPPYPTVVNGQPGPYYMPPSQFVVVPSQGGAQIPTSDNSGSVPTKGAGSTTLPPAYQEKTPLN